MHASVILFGLDLDSTPFSYAARLDEGLHHFLNCIFVFSLRGIVCNNGEVVMSTRDHKPFNNEERDRIEAAGGHVFMRRVDGDLAVSRALGDFQYKDAHLPAAKCKVVLRNG